MAPLNPHTDSKFARGRMANPAKGKFFLVGPDFRRGGAPGFEIANKSRVLQGRRALGPLSSERGFPDYPEPPLIRLDKKLGRPLRDLEQCHEYWLVSAAAKDMMQHLDEKAFAFLICDVILENGEKGPDYWFCDVIRILDAVDEKTSSITILSDAQGEKKYKLAGGAKIAFRTDITGSAHIFRLSHLTPAIFCDARFKSACKAAGLKGINFRDAANL
jgi:hypothetical protein